MVRIIVIVLLFFSVSVHAETQGDQASFFDSKKQVEVEFKQKKILLSSILETSPIGSNKTPEVVKQNVIENIKLVGSNSRRVSLFLVEDVKTATQLETDNVDSALQTKHLVEIGKAKQYDEVYLVTRIGLIQYGVELEEDHKDDENKNQGFWESVLISIIDDALSDEDDETYPNNIYSELSVVMQRIDIKSGDNVGSYTIRAAHEGGDKSFSYHSVLSNFNRIFEQQLKQWYPVGGFGYRESSNFILLQKGENEGIKSGNLFVVITHDSKVILHGDALESPGQQVALAQAVDVSPSSSRLAIVRQWGSFDDSAKIKEIQKGITRLDWALSKGIENSVFTLGMNVSFYPFSVSNYLMGIKYSRADDSRGDNSSALTFDFLYERKYFHLNKYAFRVGGGLDFNIFFREDDANNSASGFVFAIPVFTKLEYKFSRNKDIFFGVGYRLSLNNPSWTYSVGSGEDASSKDAVWNGPAPKIDLSGVYAELGVSVYTF